MASTAPSPTRDSVKTSVVVILVDSNAHLSQPENYIDPLLKCLTEANDPPQQIYLGWVRYGPSQRSGSPSWTGAPFPLVGAHNRPIALQTVFETSSGTAVLDSYAAAFQMIDNFKFQRTPKPNPQEEFSYHLWHIADGLNDEATNSPSYFGFGSSQAFWNLTWETIPTEIQSRNIKLSMILLRSSPRLTALFSAVSPEKIKPWFPICPRHEFLLSGLEPPTQLGDAIPSTVLAKRPADSDPPAEHRSQRLKVEDTSQTITPPSLAPADTLSMLGTPPSSYSSPPVSCIRAPDLPTQSPAGEINNMMDDQWSGMLYWSSGESGVCASIQATNWVRNPKPTTWPRDLRLEIIEAGIGALDIQAWILRHKAPVARIRWTPEIGNQDFGKLVKSLRERKCVAIARWEVETEGSPKPGLVLVPFYEALLCAAFPASDIPELPKPWLQQPQEKTELQADYPPPANSL